MPKKTIKTDHAPAAIGPILKLWLQATCFLRPGSFPLILPPEKFPKAALKTRPTSYSKTWKRLPRRPDEPGQCRQTTVFLADITNFQAVNSVYAQYFKSPIQRAVPSRWPHCHWGRMSRWKPFSSYSAHCPPAYRTISGWSMTALLETRAIIMGATNIRQQALQSNS